MLETPPKEYNIVHRSYLHGTTQHDRKCQLRIVNNDIYQWKTTLLDSITNRI